MDSFLTTYKKDYVPKVSRRPDHKGENSEYQYPVREGFKNYLHLSSFPSPPEASIENADIYLEKQEKIRPKITKMHFQTPINNEVMKKVFIYNGRTEYQVGYCDLEKDEEYKEEQRRKNAFRLPNDSYIPLTTQTYSYRNPITINSKAMERIKPCRIPNNLGAEEHIRKILKVKTPKTEYGGVIGGLGDFVMDHELHGKIEHDV